MQTKERANEWRQNRIQNGLCVRCGNKRDKKSKSLQHCSICLILAAQYSCRRYRRLKKLGKCTKCGKKAIISKDKSLCLCKFHMQEKIKRNLEFRHKRKDLVYYHYGGYVCACCGETEPLFLSIDHIFGYGTNHRKELKKRYGGQSDILYRWLIENNYPQGYQVLCMNCNHGRSRNNGICPHEKGGK